MKLYREPAGVISEGAVWVLLDPLGYMYIGGSLPALLWEVLAGWRDDRSLIG